MKISDWNAPSLPKETCPAIDAIIKEAKSQIKDISYALTRRDDDAEYLCEMLENASYEFQRIIDDIEELRDANAKLREYGVYYKDIFDEAVSELEVARQAA